MKRFVFLTFLVLVNSAVFCNTYEDYLVTKNGDTIFGKIEWKTNVTVNVINSDGKQKFRADNVHFFQRGDFRFVSVNTKFPEFLLEVINGKLSYYKESHLKPKYTINYKRRVYIIYKEILYPISFEDSQSISDIRDEYQLPTLNNESNLTESTSAFPNSYIDQSKFNKSHSSDFRWPFLQILGRDHELFKLINNNNFSEDDIEFLVTLSNAILNDNSKLNQLIDPNLEKGYAQGYVISSKKDTIYGAIKLKRKFVSGEKLRFMNLQGEKYTYKPSELNEFKINNRVYLNRIVDKKRTTLKVILLGKISLYRDLKNSKSYLKKEGSQSFLEVDKKNKFLKIFRDNDNVYSRIIENEYKKYEIKSMVRLYNKG